ncbi:hypothetical protein BC829DRAFT_486549 [Chytridium lagenaria]|nr:hypothetical protein BC829DRAFT_486549 [Chytridium lagenaria]
MHTSNTTLVSVEATDSSVRKSKFIFPVAELRIEENPQRIDDEPVTLYRILAPYRLNEDNYFTENMGSMFIVKRLLGMYPQTMTTVAHFPPAADLVGKCAPVFNNAPITDLNLGCMTAHLRRLIETLTAMTAECAYCTAHNCGLGDVFRGGAMHQRKPKVFHTLPEKLSLKERDALRLVVAAVKVPARVNASIRQQAIASFGLDGLQVIIRPMALIGYLATVMETLGCELEDECAEFAAATLTEKEWAKVKTHGYSKWWDSKTEDPAVSSLTRLLGYNPLTNLIDLILNIMRAEAGSPKTTIPKDHTGLNAWSITNLGFLPRWFRDVIDPQFKHCLAFVINSLILADPTDFLDRLDDKNRPTLSSNDKIVAGFVYFMAAENGLLARHFAVLAHKRGISAQILDRAFIVSQTLLPARIEVTVTGKKIYMDDVTGLPRTLHDHMAMMASAEARRLRYDLDLLCEQLFDLTDRSPRAVMEVVALCVFLP